MRYGKVWSRVRLGLEGVQTALGRVCRSCLAILRTRLSSDMEISDAQPEYFRRSLSHFAPL